MSRKDIRCRAADSIVAVLTGLGGLFLVLAAGDTTSLFFTSRYLFSEGVGVFFTFSGFFLVSIGVFWFQPFEK